MRAVAKVLVLAALLVALDQSSSEAASITLDATTRGMTGQDVIFGNVVSFGGSATSEFAAGHLGSPIDWRNWFTFDLTSVVDPIVSATLLLSMPSAGFLSSDPTETYSLSDISTANLGVLGTNSFAAYADLATGTVYGSRSVSSADNGTLVAMSLNGAAVGALNGALGSTIGIGGAVTTLGFSTAEGIFSGSAGGITRLVLETRDSTPVPEPVTLLLVSSGLAVAIGRRARRAR